MMSLALSAPLSVRAAPARAARRAPRSAARRAVPARAGSVEIVRDDEPRRVSGDSAVSEGLAISGAVMALNGGVGSFTVREDVNVTRSEEGGRTTVTIKVRLLARLDQCRRVASRSGPAAAQKAGSSGGRWNLTASGARGGWRASRLAGVASACPAHGSVARPRGGRSRALRV